MPKVVTTVPSWGFTGRATHAGCDCINWGGLFFASNQERLIDYIITYVLMLLDGFARLYSRDDAVGNCVTE